MIHIIQPRENGGRWCEWQDGWGVCEFVCLRHPFLLLQKPLAFGFVGAQPRELECSCAHVFS